MSYVLDASVLLAIVRQEPGVELALELSRRGAMSWLNAGEVLSKVVERGGDETDARVVLNWLDITFHDLIRDDAIEIARLLPHTRHAGLSFGDRACMALGRRLGLPVLTAERSWSRVEVGVQVRLPR